MALDVRQPVRQQGLEDRPRRGQMQPVLRVGGRAGQRFLEKRGPDPLQPANVPERRGRPRLVLDHLRQQRQPHRRDLAVLGQLRDRLVEETLVRPRVTLTEAVVGHPDRPQHPTGVDQVEGVHRGEVLALHQPDLQVPHEPGGRHREVVADQDDALDAGPVALPQGPDQLGLAFAPIPFGMEPLLELVQDDQDLAAGWDQGTAAQPRDGLDQAHPGGTSFGCPTQGVAEARFRRARGRLDIHPDDRGRDLAEQPGADHRRLPAAAGPAEQADAEGTLPLTGIDPDLPEAEALRQPVAIARAGQQAQEEVAILDVERPQALGSNLDCRPHSGVRGGRVLLRVGLSPRPCDRSAPAVAKARGSRRSQPESQVIGQVGGGRVAVGHPLGEAFQADPLELLRDGPVPLARRDRLAIEDLVEELVVAPALERPRRVSIR